VRKLQAARVPHRLAVYVGGLAALRDWRVAMDHHDSVRVLLPVYTLLYDPRRICCEPHQSTVQGHCLVH
jgi:hypothetical protein